MPLTACILRAQEEAVLPVRTTSFRTVAGPDFQVFAPASHTAQLADEPGNMPHSTAERPWDQGQSWVLYFLNYWKAETRALTGPQSIE